MVKKSNLELYRSYKESDIVNFIKIQRIKWAGHVIRMNEDHTTKRAFNAPPIDTRRKGRPNLRGGVYVTDDLARARFPTKDEESRISVTNCVSVMFIQVHSPA
ncbi:uncharacterized protein TNCV_3572581 [Trichonephila clavipes]|nr:uncharacterized protein TNCV_3572581 [Trichonephila clavipes]